MDVRRAGEPAPRSPRCSVRTPIPSYRPRLVDRLMGVLLYCGPFAPRQPSLISFYDIFWNQAVGSEVDAKSPGAGERIRSGETVASVPDGPTDSVPLSPVL